MPNIGKKHIKYLINERFLSSDEIINNGLEVMNNESKNFSLSIQTKLKSYLIKQSKLSIDSSIKKEAQVYSFMSSSATPIIKNHIPRFFLYNEDYDILVIEFLNGKTFYDFHKVLKRYPSYLGVQTACVLASLHNLNPRDFQHLSFKAPKPWVLNLVAPPVQFLTTESSGTLALFKIVQSEPALIRSLLEINNIWQFDAFCHNDIRLTNLFCSNQNGKNKKSHVYILDWELYGLSYSLWDLACFFEGYIKLWIIEASKKDLKNSKVKTISFFQKLIFSFWANYKKNSIKDNLIQISSISKISKMLGLRLLQSSMEYSQNSNEPTQESMVLLQTAKRFCERPLEAWVHILGFPLSSRSGQIKIK